MFWSMFKGNNPCHIKVIWMTKTSISWWNMCTSFSIWSNNKNVRYKIKNNPSFEPFFQDLLEKYLIDEETMKKYKDAAANNENTDMKDSLVFYLKMKGDYYRYLAEVSTDEEKNGKKLGMVHRCQRYVFCLWIQWASLHQTSLAAKFFITWWIRCSRKSFPVFLSWMLISCGWAKDKSVHLWLKKKCSI